MTDLLIIAAYPEVPIDRMTLFDPHIFGEFPWHLFGVLHEETKYVKFRARYGRLIEVAHNMSLAEGTWTRIIRYDAQAAPAVFFRMSGQLLRRKQHDTLEWISQRQAIVEIAGA